MVFFSGSWEMTLTTSVAFTFVTTIHLRQHITYIKHIYCSLSQKKYCPAFKPKEKYLSSPLFYLISGYYFWETIFFIFTALAIACLLTRKN
jgi:hypothetical protein